MCESLRGQLEAHWRLSLRPCSSLRQGDYGAYAPQGLPLASPDWAWCCQQGDFLCVRLQDTALLALGHAGLRQNEGRVNWLTRLAHQFGAQPGAEVEPEFRPLWLCLDSALYFLEKNEPALFKDSSSQAWARIFRVYEAQALAGASQARLGYPRLAQLASLAGRLSGLAIPAPDRGHCDGPDSVPSP